MGNLIKPTTETNYIQPLPGPPQKLLLPESAASDLATTSQHLAHASP